MQRPSMSNDAIQPSSKKIRLRKSRAVLKFIRILDG